MRTAVMLSSLLLVACDAISGLNDFEVPPSSSTATAQGGGGSGATGGTGATGGMGGAGGDAPTPSACDEVVGGTGIHEIDPDGEGGNDAFDAYCEQQLADGGWTLVARSTVGGTGNFGWQEDHGTAQDSQQPYSLDVDRVELVFSEILLVARGADPQAFVVDNIASDWLIDHERDAWSTDGDVTTVQGDCDPGGGPQMLGYLGFTDRDDVFFVRDTPDELGVHGLFPDGWNLNGDNDCNYEGDLGDQQGEIYVR